MGLIRSDVVVRYNNFLKHMVELRQAGVDLVTETAEAIKADAAQTWSDTEIPFRVRYRNQGTFTQDGGNRAEVIAGNQKHWYSLFLENGTIDQAARPAMTPAAERAAPEFYRKARRIEKKLG